MTRINIPRRIEAQLASEYLQMLAMAIGYLSMNMGAQRKHIWDFVRTNYDNSVDYNTFLLAIHQLTDDGKIQKNDNGYLWI